MMKSVLILDGAADPENPNDPEYTNGLDHGAFRDRANQRLIGFSQECLEADRVEVVAAEKLAFADFCKLLTQDWDRVVLPGSAHSVHDQINWIRDLKRALVETGKETRAPIVGICFGAQMLAVAEGGQVRRLESTRKGLVALEGFGFEVAVNHTEIIDPPASLRVFGKSLDGLPYLMRSGDDFAIQAHPEIPFDSDKPFDNPWRKILALE